MYLACRLHEPHPPAGIGLDLGRQSVGNYRLALDKIRYVHHVAAPYHRAPGAAKPFRMTLETMCWFRIRLSVTGSSSLIRATVTSGGSGGGICHLDTTQSVVR